MPSYARSLALLLTAGVSTACALGPQYEPPEIPVSTRFLGQVDVEHRDARRAADLQS